MLKVILCVFLYISAYNVKANFYKTNITDFSKCKVHYSRTSSVYKDFYEISDIPDQNETLLLDFHFSVLAPGDAHILLAPSENVEKEDPVYEIVIGAGGNTFCDIRRRQKSDVKASVRITGLLSALDPNSFWLHIEKDGNIAVGKEGKEEPFIHWKDPDPLPLKVISFSTWSGIEAKWYFSCERNTENQEIKRNLTHIEQLRQDLLHNYNPFVRPVRNISTVTAVSMALHINNIQLNEYKSNIEVVGMTKLAWHDEKLRWDPVEYGDLENLHIFRKEIWHPDLVLYNAINDGRNILKDSMMVAHSTGLVEWNPAIYLNAWCDANDMGNWPRDVHKCNLILGFMKDFDHIQLEFNKNESSLTYHEGSEWAVLEVDIYTDMSTTHDITNPAIFEIFFTVKRISDIYNAMFFAPFIVISVSILSSFWMTPFGNNKISLICSQLILTTLMILVLAVFIPSHPNQVPYLVILYSSTLVATLVSAIIAIIVINLSRNKQSTSLPPCICNLLTSKILRIALCLPEMDMFDEYGKLNETYTKSPEKQQLMWILLGMTIDRISFLIYLPLTIYAVYLNFK